ncbi:hypothetical protein E1091_09140 [Micromonospora fluostatini]|uniref:Uncharacterized protein n=1 Tax=Micromonospora fluostatini TaxID=1629071 RepID=A0ABY2DHU3_9ACTN|nr:hypothetical protein E1091_09140 [Micromonospora fluostatini]
MHARDEPERNTLGPPRPRRAVGSAGHAPEATATPGDLSPRALLALQRSTGNAAVGRLLAGRRPGAGAVQRAPATTTTPAPALDAVLLTGLNEEGVCGNFSRRREWAVSNPQRGVIIQRVTREFDVERHTPQGWTSISGAALDAYVAPSGGSADATVLEYWELWLVDEDGTVSDGGDDTFGLTALIGDTGQYHDTTRGSYTIRGEAAFYPTGQDPAALGFQRNAVTTAGGLFSSTTAPQVSSLGLTRSGGPVRYGVRATWDSTDKRSRSAQAKPRAATAGPYTPRAAWSTVVEL